MTPLGFFVQRARPHARGLALLAGLAALQSAALLLVPWFGGQLLGDIVLGRGLSTAPLAALLVAALAAVALVSTLAAIASAYATAEILGALRRDAYDHVMSLPVAFHDHQRQGETMSLITYEVNNLSTFLTGTLASVPATVLTATGALVALFTLDPVLALAVPLLVPAFVIALRLAGRRLRHAAYEVRLAEVGLVSEAESQLGLVHAIKAFAAETRQAARYRDRIAATVRQRRALARVASAIGPATGLVAGCGVILILTLAGNRVAEGQMSPSDLFRFFLYAALMTRPIAALGGFYGSMQTARGTLRDLARLFDHTSEPGLASGEELAVTKGAIVFDGVRFAYPGRDVLFDAANFAVAPGQTVAFTGANGAGKSSLIALLMRFYDPEEGSILVDGVPIDRVDVRSLRRQIGYVPQRPLMFNGTVRDNVTFGMPDADDAALDAALELSQAREFVAALPDGLDTEIGDHGVLLSGGQRQRIALARALLSDPPILVFDEATSMIDLEGEAEFVAACHTALAGRTVLIVTHRPASLALADRVLKVAGGKVTEIENARTFTEDRNG